MKNKTKFFTVIKYIFLFLLITIIIAFCVKHTLKDPDDIYIISSEEGDVTRYEWLAMLCEQMGITEYREYEPYYEDVEKGNVYFKYVQAATEWNVLEQKKKFNGEEPASGRFIVLTAMKAIGEYKIQIFLETKSKISNPEYIKLAEEYNLIKKDDLVHSFNKEKCEEFLKQIEYLNVLGLWKDDYEDVTYQDGVKELSSDDIIEHTDDYKKIRISDKMEKQFSNGDIIIFQNKKTQLKIAKQISSITSSNILSLDDVEINKVIRKLTLSDISTFSFENIKRNFNLDEKNQVSDAEIIVPVVQNAYYLQLPVTEKQLSVDGFEILLKTDESEKVEDANKVSIYVVDHKTNIKYKLPYTYALNDDCVIDAKLNVPQIDVASQIEYSALCGIEHAEVQVESNMEVTGSIAGTFEEEKIPLLCAPVAIGNGIAGVELQMYLVMSAEGKFSIEAEMPVQLNVCYQANNGFRNSKRSISMKKPKIEVNCVLNTSVRAEPVLVLFSSYNVVDIEIDTGATAEVEAIKRPTSQTCIDVSIAYPVVTIYVSGDDDIDTLLKGIDKHIDYDLAPRWNIIKKDSALFQIRLHYEAYEDGTSKFVNKCTYHEQEKKEEKINDNIEDTGYYNYDVGLMFSTHDKWKDEGTYYSVKGTLSSYACIKADVFDTLKTGEHFKIGDTEYIKTDEISSFGVRLLDKNGEHYAVAIKIEANSNLNNLGGMKEDFYGLANDPDYYNPHNIINILEEDYFVKIRKNALISLFDYDIKKYVEHTAEECFKKSLTARIIEGHLETEGHGKFTEGDYSEMYVTFDKDGYISGMNESSTVGDVTKLSLWGEEDFIE